MGAAARPRGRRRRRGRRGSLRVFAPAGRRRSPDPGGTRPWTRACARRARGLCRRVIGGGDGRARGVVSGVSGVFTRANVRALRRCLGARVLLAEPDRDVFALRDLTERAPPPPPPPARTRSLGPRPPRPAPPPPRRRRLPRGRRRRARLRPRLGRPRVPPRVRPRRRRERRRRLRRRRKRPRRARRTAASTATGTGRTSPPSSPGDSTASRRRRSSTPSACSGAAAPGR